MQDVISQLPKTHKFYFFLEEERNRNFRCSNSKDNVINVAGKMKLQQELLISNLDVMVSMDSGNVYMLE
jgi:hypothetical protein